MTRRQNETTGNEPEAGEGFGELLKYTLAGYIGGLSLAALLDAWGQQHSAVGQWLVRTLSGEGESIFEGIYAIRARISAHAASLAEAYGWGKFLGMVAPWVIDWASRSAGVDMYAAESFYVPYFYALGDQIGANVAGFVFLRRKTGRTVTALSSYIRNPVMVSSLAIVLLVPVGLFIARLLGFSPTTQILTAFETIVANLCWIPPLVGSLQERRKLY